ncbi:MULTISPECIES: DNA polymerase I [Clostridium]|uniref:DNA polymerase I n=1 Tax=Clostridium saccharoperbutylacetonicum N1-4(HMT) TaxID=931276 RepID=M1ME50_9CLOT|nr:MULTISPECIES: DNA polymerase I [Clostridium]AGF54658.1 DNA polymerase I [Clostridium saccharoperbutylacetonicum N1-4(HMT)]AQR93613.1 DNA polymerase I [Clostridium saccharoperbutylacetonicum]NRT58821.1 DNA polymerase-1 [Clostridium saccharoperbutylacetonicum]NSB28010.1 DNA polymerase-1 [Clostridium saccharoperbutylacetonicum]NSB29312.1 DNA polymerase-1 [Clostridium saccharoperbutylacetonicum]
MKKLLILDSNSLMNRAFYALPPLTNSDGINTNAIYGFINMLFKIKDEINPDSIIATFDLKAPTFRHKEYAEYKAGRNKMPPELAEQFPIIKDLFKLMGIKIFEIEGFEADDLIGTVSKFAENNATEVAIVTGDKDALQLASDSTKVIITKKGVSETAVYDSKTFIDEFEVTPTQFIDVKGLMGDKSDNIPGVPGVGEKTAFKLIKEYGSVEEVMKNIDNIPGKKLKENLENNVEQAIFSKKLATIMREVPIELTLDDINSMEKENIAEIKKMLIKLEMKSILAKFKDDTVSEESTVEIKKIHNIKEMKELFLEKKNRIYIDYTLSDASIYSKLELEYLVLGEDNKGIIIYFKDIISENKDEALKVLRTLMEDENIKKVIHDGKNFVTYLNKNKIEIKGFDFDTAIAAYLIDSSKNKYEILELVNRYIGDNPNTEDENLKGILSSYLPEIYEELKETLHKENMDKLYYEVEHPLIYVLSSMESIGFNINKGMLDELQIKFKKEIEETQNEIYKLSEEEFNISSPKQLGKILFEKLDLPVLKKTKTGYSTNQEVLEKLIDKHEIIPKIMYYRQITKINSTYVEGLKNVIDEDGRIHSNFNQTVTTTGRLSSTEPNLQNIPIKYEMGREIRKVFIPMEETDILVSCDYSQIELRVLAHIAGDENMIDAFEHHSDIHTKTASEVFKVPIDEVTSLMRSRAKAVNFGIVYGISAFSLAEDLKISKKEAEEYMSIYLERYPKIKEYLENVVKEAQEKGYVLTILNRRRFIPEIKASNKIVKALGDRLAMNAPIQGSAADIIKLAMVNVYNKLNEKNLKSELILQVHDELILNVKKEEFEEVKKLVAEEMENAIKLKVALDVDVNFGKTWYDAK